MSFEAAKRLQDAADRLASIIAERKSSDLKLSDSDLDALAGLVDELDVVVTSYEELLSREIE